MEYIDKNNKKYLNEQNLNSINENSNDLNLSKSDISEGEYVMNDNVSSVESWENPKTSI